MSVPHPLPPGFTVFGAAPGRLDFLGGVADYCGSLVLEMPIAATTKVEISGLETPRLQFRSASQSGSFEITLADWQALAERTAAQLRDFLREKNAPRWSHYVLGCLWLFAREMGWQPSDGLSFQVDSEVPTSMGVSSSAALEVATLRALEALSSKRFEGTALAKLAQRAENEVVGAPCGLMDQLASAHGVAGALLPILCRPDILGAPIPLPEGVVVAGWPSGAQHAVSASPYATARAAAFMGKKLLEAHFERDFAFLTELAPSQVRALNFEVLPLQLSGAQFLARWGGVDDALSKIEAERVYPVRDGAFFPIEENQRCGLATALLRGGREDDLARVGELMFQSHAGYSSIGLGHPQTDAMVEAVRQLGPENGFYGARVSGGGSGGTVVVLARQEALPALGNLGALPQQLILSIAPVQ